MAKTENDFSSPADMFLSGQPENAQADKKENPQTDAGDPAKTDPAIPAGYRLVRETKSERMQLLVTPRIKTGIEAAAKSQGTSANSLINIILQDYLDKGAE